MCPARVVTRGLQVSRSTGSRLAVAPAGPLTPRQGRDGYVGLAGAEEVIGLHEYVTLHQVVRQYFSRVATLNKYQVAEKPLVRRVLKRMKSSRSLLGQPDDEADEEVQEHLRALERRKQRGGYTQAPPASPRKLLEPPRLGPLYTCAPRLESRIVCVEEED